MGLVKEGDKVRVLTDILGDEDHLGDMDFKVAGTADGVTAIQMDNKVGGVTRDVMRQALHQARDARLFILSVMAEGARSSRARKFRPTRRASSRCRSSPTRSATSSARAAR